MGTAVGGMVTEELVDTGESVVVFEELLASEHPDNCGSSGAEYIFERGHRWTSR